MIFNVEGLKNNVKHQAGFFKSNEFKKIGHE